MNFTRINDRASLARADLSTLEQIKQVLERAAAQGLIEAYRVARELEYIDPDEVAAELEKYFGPDGAWTDLAVDALWTF